MVSILERWRAQWDAMPDEMIAGIQHIVRVLVASSPLQNADPDVVELPFHEKKFLFRMLVEDLWVKARAERRRTPLFSKPPKYSTFIRALQLPVFAKLRFHRMVSLGRCTKCAFFRWKCMSVSSEDERRAWQKVAAAHHLLQLDQKRIYWADRAVAASDYPKSELYLAFDGGSGYEFWLPHLSGAAAEVPVKAADNVHCPQFKVMNGLVHGDTRSHIILSPWCVVAGSNHVCECIAIAVNTAYEEHGNLPRKLSVQMDNASVNHSMCVLGFLAIYALVDVFDVVRLRFELPDHAHDVYDAFHSIHRTAVAKETFFHLEELIDIMKASHKASLLHRESSESSGSSGWQSQGGHRPVMGPDVLVTNLWEIRDIWEWLFPGHSTKSAESTARGGVMYYENIGGIHDFELRRARDGGMPPQLALHMHRMGLRGRKCARESAAISPEASAALQATGDAPVPRQRWHALQQTCGIRRSEGTPIAALPRSCPPSTVDEFVRRPVIAGVHVLTDPAPNSPLGRTRQRLVGLPVWVWRVLRIIEVGGRLPPNSKHVAEATGRTFEAQLLVPRGPLWSGPLKPAWRRGEVAFLLTPAEKAARRQAQSSPVSRPASLASAQVTQSNVPVTAMLRPENIIGGGFGLTASMCAPTVVRQFVASRSAGGG
ncbi:unnamed protein product [Prorocentrum cordatum]|uniref:DUF7869 domain-containing protein n=1 Tax=Prorocentrum cordatum TaxID=2364126 RepID=A0ABN9SF72_9DINO|nr:unnamed protein product [Polarella glacialis]